MATQKQSRCKKCGTVLAVKNSPPTCGEYVGVGVLVAVTLGLGLIAAVPWAMWRGVKANHYHCSKCGGRVR